MTMPKDKKIAFLDRDGVINKKSPDHHYITKTSEFKFNRGIFKMLKDLKKSGYEFIIITNQRGVARKQLTEERLQKINELMSKELRKRGLRILGIFYCPHETNQCSCRKPKPGLLKKACLDYPIDIKRSILISDSPEDITMGKKFGLKDNFLIKTDKPKIML